MLLEGTEASSRRFPFRALIRLLTCTLVFAASARTQEERKHKVPGLDKITAEAEHQAFSGKVQSLDQKEHILNVNTVQGGDTEIFPIKKGIHITSADGEKLKLAALTPGTNVIVYYDQKNDRRTVKEIVVLSSGPSEEKKKTPH